MREVRQVRELCGRLPGTIETFPFSATTLVFKVGGTSAQDRSQPEARAARVWKMYALAPIHTDPASLSVKCPPDLSEALREQHPAIKPGDHLNKRHWITVTLDGTVPEALLRELLEGSYALVRASLPAGVRACLPDWPSRGVSETPTSTN